MGFRPLTTEQWHSSLRIGIASLIAAAITLRWNGSSSLDLWYCLYGVARSNLADQRLSSRLARERIVGTLFGGGVGCALLLLGPGWIWIGVGYLLVQLLGSHWNLSGGSRSNGAVAVLLMMMVPADSAAGPTYVLARVLWHLLGLSIGMAVEHLFWPRGDREQREQLEAKLLGLLADLDLQPDAVRAQRQERQLVELFRQIREMAQLSAHSDPSVGTDLPGEGRLQALEQAVIHGAALLRHPHGPSAEGPLAQRCLSLEREALAGKLAFLTGAVGPAWAVGPAGAAAPA
ncbi:FUSC family protein [Synechococcus sp. CS-1325]|uniref:FUSC family protein n=1 Tax=Synechococcus sp. CS-1325 TaxID=2847979 RepID=UPI000DAF8BCA|nr:FUSC family protein [Synechococcus sp. CS-1325]MCT0200264.1 FUSC family protein [Synechococcus sp. CS-1325]PZV01604.1 MAG: hypothetical protein DCF24_03960 [Cyanobium sp.]